MPMMDIHVMILMALVDFLPKRYLAAMVRMSFMVQTYGKRQIMPHFVVFKPSICLTINDFNQTTYVSGKTPTLDFEPVFAFYI